MLTKIATRVSEAIRESCTTELIVFLPWTLELEEELSCFANDAAVNGTVYEFWGLRDGQDWRVHLTETPANRYWSY
jgi:hypothetical protein